MKTGTMLLSITSLTCLWGALSGAVQAQDADWTFDPCPSNVCSGRIALDASGCEGDWVGLMASSAGSSGSTMLLWAGSPNDQVELACKPGVTYFGTVTRAAQACGITPLAIESVSFVCGQQAPIRVAGTLECGPAVDLVGAFEPVQVRAERAALRCNANAASFDLASCKTWVAKLNQSRQLLGAALDAYSARCETTAGPTGCVGSGADAHTAAVALLRGARAAKIRCDATDPSYDAALCLEEGAALPQLYIDLYLAGIPVTSLCTQ